VGVKLEPARSFLVRGEISLQPITLELPASSPDRPEVTRASRASPQHFNEALQGHLCLRGGNPKFICSGFDAPRVTADRSLAAPFHGLHI
jgi:hypothetical protein